MLCLYGGHVQGGNKCFGIKISTGWAFVSSGVTKAKPFGCTLMVPTKVGRIALSNRLQSFFLFGLSTIFITCKGFYPPLFSDVTMQKRTEKGKGKGNGNIFFILSLFTRFLACFSISFS